VTAPPITGNNSDKTRSIVNARHPLRRRFSSLGARLIVASFDVNTEKNGAARLSSLLSPLHVVIVDGKAAQK
jgi:hypothetical protein